MEGVPTDKQRKGEKRRQIKEGKKAEKANNPYGIGNYSANSGQQYDVQYGQANAAGDNCYHESATGHSVSYNFQVAPPVITEIFIRNGNNYANGYGNSNVEYQGGSNHYHARTDENYRTHVATDGMVETINGKQKGRKGKEAKY